MSASEKNLVHAEQAKLFRVKFDDELLVDGRRLNVVAARQRSDFGFEGVFIDFKPGHGVAALRDVTRVENHGVVMHIRAQRNFFAGADQIRRDIHLLAVHENMAVENNLASLSARAAEADAPDNVIEPALEHDDKVFAGRAFGTLGFLVEIAELAFEQSVGALDLLLLAKLQAVSGNLRTARLAVLAGHEIPLFDFALLCKTPKALQEKLLAFPAAQAANCFTMSCQSCFSFATRTCVYRLDAPTFRRAATVMRN